MAADDRDEQLNSIRSTVTGCDADHFEPRIVVGGDGSTDRRDRIEI